MRDNLQFQSAYEDHCLAQENEETELESRLAPSERIFQWSKSLCQTPGR